MSANKIVLVSSNSVPVSAVQQQPAASTESAKKMARKDKEFLWELDSQVKGIVHFLFSPKMSHMLAGLVLYRFVFSRSSGP